MAKRRNRKREKQKKQEIIYYIVALLAISIILISLLKLGSAGLFLDTLFKNVFGNVSYYFVMIQLLCFFGYILFQGKILSLKSRYVIGSILLLNEE